VVSNWVGKFGTDRITFTAPLINHAKAVMFLIAGSDKSSALGEVPEGHRLEIVSVKTDSLDKRAVHLAGGPGRRGRVIPKERLGSVTAPVGNFLQTISQRVLEQPHHVAGMLEFVDIGPDFRLPSRIVGSRFSARGATRV